MKEVSNYHEVEKYSIAVLSAYPEYYIRCENYLYFKHKSEISFGKYFLDAATPEIGENGISEKYSLDLILQDISIPPELKKEIIYNIHLLE